MSLLTSKELLEAWHRAAPDADRSFAVPSADSFFRKEIDDSETLKRLTEALQQRLTYVHADFIAHAHYGWALDKNIYHPSAEALYQLHVIDVAAGIWRDCDETQRKSCSFSNIMARETRLWGGVGLVSPKARFSEGIPFVVVPYGWDDHLHVCIKGLEAFSPSVLDHKHIVPQSSMQMAFLLDSAIPSWNGLLARAITSELGCHDLLAPLCVERLCKEIPQLQGAVCTMTGHTSLDTSLSRCSLAMLFSIAHEVGHHLADTIPKFDGDDEEQHADRLAYMGLWNCPGAVRELKCSDELDDCLIVTAGALFWSALEIGISVHKVVRQAYQEDTQLNPSIAARIATWNQTTEILAKNHPDIHSAYTGSKMLSQVTREYAQAFHRHARDIIADVSAAARDIIEQIHSAYPEIHHLPSLERRLSDEIRKRQQD